MNQCDGCRRGIPKNGNGRHIGPGGFWAGDTQACTAHLYVELVPRYASMDDLPDVVHTSSYIRMFEKAIGK